MKRFICALACVASLLACTGCSDEAIDAFVEGVNGAMDAEDDFYSKVGDKINSLADAEDGLMQDIGNAINSAADKEDKIMSAFEGTSSSTTVSDGNSDVDSDELIQYIEKSCPSCQATFEIESDVDPVVCPYCDYVFPDKEESKEGGVSEVRSEIDE